MAQTLTTTYPFIETHTVWNHTFQFEVSDFQSDDWYSLAGRMRKQNLTMPEAQTELNGWNLPLRNIIKRGDRVIDLGANAGHITLCIAKQVGSGGRVLAFEPDPYNVQKIYRNIELNDLHNILVLPIAIGSTTEFVYVQHEVIKREECSLGKQVFMTTLDTFHDFIPDVIKIDVEGFEVEVLRGANKILGRFHPRMEIEIHTGGTDNTGIDLRQMGYTLEELWNLLTYYSYTIMIDDKPIDLPRLLDHCGVIYCT